MSRDTSALRCHCGSDVVKMRFSRYCSFHRAAQIDHKKAIHSGSYYLYKFCTVSGMPPFSFPIMKLWILCFSLWFLLLFYQYYESVQRTSYWLCGDFIWFVLFLSSYFKDFCYPLYISFLLLWVDFLFSSYLPEWKPRDFSTFMSSTRCRECSLFGSRHRFTCSPLIFPCHSFLIVETSIFSHFGCGFSFGDW